MITTNVREDVIQVLVNAKMSGHNIARQNNIKTLIPTDDCDTHLLHVSTISDMLTKAYIDGYKAHAVKAKML
jgi:hypothetical protein